MTEVAFHFNAPDKVAYACRLMRKATAGGARLVVLGDDETLGLLDKALWNMAPHEFIAHCKADAPAFVVAASPVVLSSTAQAMPHQQVLVNLGEEVPAGFGSFERLIEVVGRDDEADRNRARGRWKHYADRGYTIVRHDLALRS
ncbi:DNA polymerase III subunit chi [Xylophilus rhododendri]|uniref:DNA polymerase III subunit chi n=1 Tax=Xylophilus rhododendri TaxID=2697032 RepID=A0A857IYM8_9BURK|nr:DNA polymerase III subunit chi [Xylophilus rhododendri]QHI96556.1 DNA polymerase III subunit chi [Xylophilus rhododendri]